ncbi:unnamed protein product [Medioppia subpectinata]|uniref:G-protein coupled receptors family 1 profile domain-containing protein n=1 Tax=Medioppia subpectinata TaxID=1979941 RepID=A0A7R9PYZ3_9ACAR|nr:unnamed protein product [Medioppia subpectinata]CAG2106386.1 unnamed protein product [Medioppia subpectinata]
MVLFSHSSAEIKYRLTLTKVRGYNVIILLVTYMLPIVSMSYTYFRVGRELWGSQSIGECTAKQMESIKSKRKIVKMMMMVVAIFGVCIPKRLLYNVIILLVTYMLPIVSMSYTYFRVGRELWGSQSIGECTAKQMESIKSKRKIVKMMMMVVAIFGICWAPYHVYFLLMHHYPEIISSDYVQHIYLSIYWLAMSNSIYNPFVYCWMNSRGIYN